MLKITAPRLVKNLREDVDWMDCISRQKDDFTECSFNGLCVEDVSKQNLSVNSSPNQSLIILPSGIAKEIM